MTTNFPHVRAALVGTPWAILPGRLESIVEVVERRLQGVRLAPEEIAALKGRREPHGAMALVPLAFDDDDERAQRTGGPRVAAPGAQQGQAPGGVIAVISVMGIIAQHASQVDDISGPGGTSTDRVGASVSAALADPQVKAMILRIDSPGGGVYGVQELADQIFAARGQKPIVAQVDSMAASAAYWIACSADEIVVTPSGQVGSIGVYGLHQDVSGAMDKAGVKGTFVSAGKYKVEGNSLEPLGDEAHQAMQDQVDGYYDSFVQAVARGRGVKAMAVQDGFGQGRVVGAKDAVKAGMADRVATLSDTLRRLGAQRPKAGGAAALVGGDVVANQVRQEASLPDMPEPLVTAAEAVVEAEPEATRPAEDPDAFRRRRHAHRGRSA